MSYPVEITNRVLKGYKDIAKRCTTAQNMITKLQKVQKKCAETENASERAGETMDGYANVWLINGQIQYFKVTVGQFIGGK